MWLAVSGFMGLRLVSGLSLASRLARSVLGLVQAPSWWRQHPSAKMDSSPRGPGRLAESASCRPPRPILPCGLRAHCVPCAASSCETMHASRYCHAWPRRAVSVFPYKVQGLRAFGESPPHPKSLLSGGVGAGRGIYAPHDPVSTWGKPNGGPHRYGWGCQQAAQEGDSGRQSQWRESRTGGAVRCLEWGWGGDCRSLVGGKEERWQMKPPVSANWRHYRKCGAILLLFSVSLTFLLR